MKTAAQAGLKWSSRAAGAAGDYTEGARTTDKDQAARAIASKAVYQQALTESFGRDAYAKGLQKSGKAGWLRGVEEKGSNNYSTGVTATSSLSKYQTESGKYDAARRAADSLPRGPRGSAQNLNKVVAVANALRAVKVGK